MSNYKNAYQRQLKISKKLKRRVSEFDKDMLQKDIIIDKQNECLKSLRDQLLPFIKDPNRKTIGLTEAINLPDGENVNDYIVRLP